MNPNVWIPLVLLAVALSAAVVWRATRPSKKAPVDNRAADLLAAGLLPLVDCPRDCDACLRCLQVDRCVVHRLLEMGLTPGAEVRVVQDAGGPMLLSVRGSRVALGRDLAEKLWVELPGATREIPLTLPFTVD
jgi:Fe2+ transport system protein FeoA